VKGIKALITGIEGFVAPYLDSFLKKQDIETTGTYFQGEKPSENTHFLDVTQKKEVFEVIKQIKPDLIFHLAGFSSVSQSFKMPELCKEINVKGSKNILDAVIGIGLNPRILMVGSAEVYGVPIKLPIKENHQIKPLSPYGESRMEQELICENIARKNNLDLIFTRSFNHTGPRQGETFVIPNFAKQIVLIEKNKQDKIMVGNLSAIRDFSDVRDVVSAYYLLIQKGKPLEKYNVCSTKGRSIKSILSQLIEFTGEEIIIEKDIDRMRPSEIPELVGDNSKCESEIGWKPKIPFSKTLKDIIEFWRSELYLY